MSLLEVFDVEQGSQEWRELRCGIPTASEFASVMAAGIGGELSKMRLKYVRRLAAEIVNGAPSLKNFTTSAMDRGKRAEPEARLNYELMYNATVRTVGFIRDGRKGCSPDGLISDDGALEIKTHDGELMVGRYHGEGETHYAQCQGTLWVARRKWLDLVWYCPEFPNIPITRRRIKRDEHYIQRLVDAVALFNEEVDAEVKFIRDHRG